jgi:hypothetical protein
MTRGHRAAHRVVWPALGLLADLGFLMALALRPPSAPSPPASFAAEQPR